MMYIILFSKILIIVGWILLAVVAQKAMNVELELTEFDPYGILGLDPVSLLTDCHIFDFSQHIINLISNLIIISLYINTV